MILTRDTFRTYKNALMQIEGRPGSAKIGEALARGFEFKDLHALEASLASQEKDLLWEPSYAYFDTLRFMAFLKGHDPQIILDMAATIMWMHDAERMIFDNYQELAGGRVRFEHILPQATKTILMETASLMLDHLGIDIVGYRPYSPNPYHFSPELNSDLIKDPWTVVDTSEDFFESESAYHIRDLDDIHDRHGRKLDEAELDRVAFESDKKGIPRLDLVLESLFMRIRHVIPEACRADFQFLVLDRTGLRATVGSGMLVEIVFI